MADDTANQTGNSKDKPETFRTWVELSYRDMAKIKRALNLPVRNSKRGQKNNSKTLEDFIAKTLKGEMTTTADRIAEVKDEFVKGLLKAWAVNLQEQDTYGMAHMLVKQAYRERDRAKQALEEALNGHASSH
jgi:hypothetical protein